VVHTLLSLQTIGVEIHPVAGVHDSVVHGFPSSQVAQGSGITIGGGATAPHNPVAAVLI